MRTTKLNKKQILDAAEQMKYDELDELMTDLYNIMDEKGDEEWRCVVLEDLIDYLSGIDNVVLFTDNDTTYDVATLIDLLTDELND